MTDDPPISFKSHPLPRHWKQSIKLAVVQMAGMVRVVLSLAEADSAWTGRNPFETQIGQLEHRVRMLTEQLRIKDGRMLRVEAARRPHYTPTERLEILQLRALEGWSRRQTARVFLLAPGTVSNWLKRVDEGGPQAILKLNVPVNKFPDFVAFAVIRLKTMCPQMGKLKIAQTLCRAGLHLSASTVGRINKRGLGGQPETTDNDSSSQPESQQGSDSHRPPSSDSSLTKNETETNPIVKAKRIVTANYPNHVWHVDLTAVPIGSGFWTPWFPFTLPQCWPFCWWVAIVVDHYSRKAIGFAVFKKQPTAIQVRTFLGRAMGKANTTPKYIISDKGVQFWNIGYKKWCQRKNIKTRFGAIGQHGSIALIERFNRSFKEFTRMLTAIPSNQKQFREECTCFMDWYNEHRPHTALKGKTPNEVYFGIKCSANQKPRIEPRKKWPRGSPCAKPQVLVAGQPGDRFMLDIGFYQGRQQLPILSLNRVA